MRICAIAKGLLTVIFIDLCGCVQATQRPLDGTSREVAPSQPAIVELQERVLEIGRTVENRPLQLFLFGSGLHPILILGGIHGSERNSAQCTHLLLAYVRGHRNVFANTSLAILPDANPDGLERGVRYNARRVDLNRNFPAANWTRNSASGRAAGSEPETRALADWIQSERPDRILSIHSIVGEPCNNFDGPAEPLARAMAAENRYAVKGDIGYPTPGSLGSWAGHDLGLPVVTLELPFAQLGEDAWNRNRTAILRFIFFKAH